MPSPYRYTETKKLHQNPTKTKKETHQKRKALSLQSHCPLNFKLREERRNIQLKFSNQIVQK